ncbi:MAG TPA: DUF4402 domain-containing protein [Bacteroidales bacterium]|nr:MAG: hypothetical protein BWX51_00390 [Bacteroidetes bacterium ADurb.Bin012]HNQ59105.1 DUF4402 domain-containing protein [Bacteroidales bacterium]HNU20840.1 DUF4402 domain-containing protein [Bacteroidales bacterium]HNV16426.1 DUF4402 domain-containing protein [Bacteroidales bacterium]HNZ78559.1 DUF4402 domain-containing protein [Bacteroidales bacterium]
MKKLGLFTAGLFVMVFAAQNVNAQSGAQASASANATATVVSVVTVAKSADLDFGTFASGLTAGTVSMETNGDRYKTGGVVLLPTDVGNPATFTAYGPATEHYFITLPDDDDVTLTLSGGTETMDISGFIHNASGIFGAGGSESFNVGGVLNVHALQAAGLYTGTFDVIVTLQ